MRSGEKAFTVAFCFSLNRGLNEWRVGSTAVSCGITMIDILSFCFVRKKFMRSMSSLVSGTAANSGVVTPANGKVGDGIEHDG